jgi:tRNA-specific 2-thiouridylase
VRAVTLLLWGDGDRRSCCSPDAVQRARESAAALGVAFEAIDRRRAFARAVVEPFVAGYLAGDTPNPCVVCNPDRLAAMVELADERGCATIATGHYARLVWRDGEPFVARGADREKDQSYMLARVAPATLARLEFPLGELTKTEVRARAALAGLAVADEPESQEVCFATRGYRAFFEGRGVQPRDGSIADANGVELGRHDGQWWFTVGQRRGLGRAAPAPLYVLARRAEGNVVVVGSHEELAARVVELDAVVDRGLGDGDGLEVQLRYKAAAIAVDGFEPLPGGRLRVELAAPFYGAAPGQAAVFYRAEAVVGSGFISGSAVR